MRNLWAYAYEIVPPQPSSRLGTIRTLLKDATAAARGGARTWSGRLVLERGASHILIVSDAPERTHAIDRRLEAELERLDAPFSVTEPLAMVTEPLAMVTEPLAVVTEPVALAGRAAGVKWLATYDGNGR